MNKYYHVIITGDAQLNFELIRDHLINNHVSKKVAVNKVIKLVKQIKYLNILPDRYQSIKERYNIPIDNNYRVMPISNYLALYKIDNRNKLVYVQRVINQKQNIKNYILKNLFS